MVKALVASFTMVALMASVWATALYAQTTSPSPTQSATPTPRPTGTTAAPTSAPSTGYGTLR